MQPSRSESAPSTQDTAPKLRIVPRDPHANTGDDLPPNGGSGGGSSGGSGNKRPAPIELDTHDCIERFIREDGNFLLIVEDLSRELGKPVTKADVLSAMSKDPVALARATKALTLLNTFELLQTSTKTLQGNFEFLEPFESSRTHTALLEAVDGMTKDAPTQVAGGNVNLTQNVLNMVPGGIRDTLRLLSSMNPADSRAAMAAAVLSIGAQVVDQPPGDAALCDEPIEPEATDGD